MTIRDWWKKRQEAASGPPDRRFQQDPGRGLLPPEPAPPPPEPRYGWVETRRTYRRKKMFGGWETETIVSRPSQRNARRRTRSRGGVKIAEEWRRIG
jgi:hypothetical protein